MDGQDSASKVIELVPAVLDETLVPSLDLDIDLKVALSECGTAKFCLEAAKKDYPKPTRNALAPLLGGEDSCLAAFGVYAQCVFFHFASSEFTQASIPSIASPFLQKHHHNPFVIL